MQSPKKQSKRWVGLATLHLRLLATMTPKEAEAVVRDSPPLQTHQAQCLLAGHGIVAGDGQALRTAVGRNEQARGIPTHQTAQQEVVGAAMSLYYVPQGR